MFGPLVLGFVGGVVASLTVMGATAYTVRRAIQRSPLGRMMAVPAPKTESASRNDLAARVAGEG